MSDPIVSRPKPGPFSRLVIALAVIGGLVLVTAIVVALMAARMEVLATPADVVGPPVRAHTAAGDRVFLLTSQWKTYRTRYSRHGMTRPAYTALLVDVWAFDAGSGRPLWRRRLESDRRGVNMGRALLGAEREVLWLLTSQGLVGLSTGDGARIADAAAIEAKNPALATLLPRSRSSSGSTRQASASDPPTDATGGWTARPSSPRWEPARRRGRPTPSRRPVCRAASAPGRSTRRGCT